MIIFSFIIIFIFLFLNYLIIKSDIKIKKIPNKYLIYLILLLPLWYYWLYYYWYFYNISFFLVFFQFIINFVLSITIYHFWIWSAWDAKYLLVLSLFIPYIWIIYIIWNIAIITLIYMLFHYLYFYFIKILFNSNYRKSLFSNIIIDLKDKLLIYFSASNWNYSKKIIFKKILIWILIFLVFYISIRLIRLKIIETIILNSWEIETTTNTLSLIYNYIKDYKSIVFISVISIFFMVYISIYYFILKIINYIKQKYPQKNEKYIENIKYIFLIFSIIILSVYIYNLYLNDPIWTIKYLKLLFTIYLLLYIILKIIKYSIKIAFIISEQSFININDLKMWTIVDKIYLNKLFWQQKWLDEKFLWTPPSEYFLKISNPINKETELKLKEIYKKVNNYHKKNNTNFFNENNSIKILNTISFGLYIFIWFITTFILWNDIYLYIINKLYDLFISI